MCADNFCALRFVGEKMIYLFNRAIECDDGEAVVVHVENDVLAHDGQSDKCDVSLCVHKSFNQDNEKMRRCEKFSSEKIIAANFEIGVKIYETSNLRVGAVILNALVETTEGRKEWFPWNFSF